MKIVTTTVGRKGPDDESWNDRRLRAAEQALAKAAELGADAIALPAGFFTTRTSQARDSTATSLISIAKRENIAVIFGVDQDVKNLSRDFRPEVRRGTLPFYAYAWSAGDKGVPHCWNQRSIDSYNQWDCPQSDCEQVRLLKIEEETLGVLICGEIFNQRIRKALENHAPMSKVVIDVAHVGQRFRVYQGMKALARVGLSSVCSVHAQCEKAVKHCYVPPGERKSEREPNDYVYGPPRIELKLWTF